MPALLVLEYCEHGTLLDHVKKTSPTELQATMLLTYCHDVASGMRFLSSRKIVHCDLAARNVRQSLCSFN
jgi:serine/threonine protein kinase